MSPRSPPSLFRQHYQSPLTTQAKQQQTGPGYFGWLFGPQFAIKDSKTLDLEQTVRAYGINADVSVPGWWTYVELAVATAWIENWSSPEIMHEDSTKAKVVHKRVKLPVTAATYKSLTNYIAAREHLQNSGIFASYVTPDVIPTCASSVTFQIGGSNIWRADSVYLGGAKAKTITVMPDMKGVAAHFEMSDVFGTLAYSDSIVQQIPLSVSAMQGSAPPLPVYVLGKRQTNNGATTCQSPLLLPTNLKAIGATVVASAPTEICSDVKSFPLIVQGFNLQNGYLADTSFFRSGESEGSSYRQVMQLHRTDPEQKLTQRSLSVVLKPNANAMGDVGPVAVTLAVKECKGADADAADTAASKATLVTETVKIAKDQPVKLKAKVPASYSEIRIALRPKTPPNADWKESDPLAPTPGDSSEVSAVMNLSAVQAKPGDKLEVVMRIRTRPGLDWQGIEADKPLEVVANYP